MANTNWEAQERSVTLTNAQWSRLSTFLVMSTNFRLGEKEAWEKLSTEKNEDGTPAFPKALDNARYWEKMNEDINEIRSAIDGLSIEEKIVDASARGAVTAADKDVQELDK